MTETKPKDWEDDFDTEYFNTGTIPTASNYSLYLSEIKSFIRKVRTDAVLEERKRIEERLLERRSWIMDTYNYEEGCDTEKAQVMMIDEVLQIINNKNI